MKNYLLSQDLWGIVEDETEPPKAEEDEAGFKTWRKKNAAALHAVQISCSSELLAEIREKSSARDAWGILADLCKLTSSSSDDIEKEPEDVAEPEDEAEPAEDSHVENINRRSLALLKQICGGDDLNTVTRYLDLINANIVRGDTRFAMHYAILGKLEIVDELLSKMSKEDLEMKDIKGRTALHFTALYQGKTKIAERLIQKNDKLVTVIAEKIDRIPLVMACEAGHEDMIYYLYYMTPREFLLSSQNQHHACLVIGYCIDNKTFDVALDLLRRCPQLATFESDFNAIRRLSRQTSAFLSTCGLSFWQRCVYSCLKVKRVEASTNDFRIHTHEQDQKATMRFNLKGKLLGLSSIVLTFFGIKQIYDLKIKHSYAHEILVLIADAVVGLDKSQIKASGVTDAIFRAARAGMTEFIAQIMKHNLDLLWLENRNRRNIFQCAVANRQEKTFSLIYGQDFLKTEFSTFIDIEGNTILHMAGKWSRFPQLPYTSEAALQMQRELQWFKEVESVVPTAFKTVTNKRGKTPDQVFNESHKKMIEGGEIWMKSIAESSIIVGTLIMTIMFAALFTVPGGNDQVTGIPLLLTRKAFKVFVISDAISLFASSTSVLMFVVILTSRYTAKDFLKSLPTKLIIALSSLFISIATMMITFCSTVIIMLRGQLAIVIPIVLLAGIPVSLFIWLQFPLLVKIIISTYGPGIFNRKMKNWLI